MSTAGLIDLPLEIFSGEAPFIPAEDLPPGASAGCQDVQFQMGMWATRQGLKSVFNPLTDSPSVNGLASFVNPAPPPIGFASNPLMVFDAMGNLYQEGEPGELAVVQLGAAKPALFMLSAQAFARMYMAFGDGIAGQDIPRQWDGNNYDRVTQQGAGAAPSVADGTATQAIAASGVPGLHQVSMTAAAISEIGNLVTINLGTFGNALDAFLIRLLQAGDFITIPTSTVTAYEGTWALSGVIQLNGSAQLQFIHPTASLADGTATVETGLALVTATAAIAPPASGASPSFVPGSSLTIAGAGVGGYDGTWPVRETGYIADQNTDTILISDTQAVVAMPTIGLADSGGGTIVVPGGISAGAHQISVIFVTRQGAMLAPPFPTTWTAAGSRQANITGIPVGPSNVVQRILCLTAANAGNFFYIPNSAMVINDNVTTTTTLDFTDTLLLAATNVDELFNVIELGECDSVTPYALRNFWIGERNKMNNWVNTGFDGGWDLGGGEAGADLPLGWTSDPSFGGGGKRQQSINPGGTVWGDAYKIVADGITSDRGMIEQGAVTDQYGQPRFQVNVGYSVRARVARSANLAAGTFRINAYSPTAGAFLTGIAVTAQQATTTYQEFIAQLMFPWVTSQSGPLPQDIVLRIYADGTPIPSGEYFLVDCVEIFPTEQPYNTTLVRASKALLPEQFDGETGIMSVPTPENDTLTASFKLREKFYICGTHCLFVTEDNGTTEPSGWSLQEVSNTVGACSGRAVGIGEEWVIMACRTGVYILWAGAEPVKISQEIQPIWDSINWAASGTIWVVVDTRAKRVAIGVPIGSAAAPNQVLYMDYQGLDTAADIASYHSVRYSPYSGKILTIGDARKWSAWSIQANSCALVERSDGTQHLFFGSSNNTGKIYDLLDGQTTDDGAAIPWSYSTHTIPAVIERQMYKLGSGRLLFGYLKGYAEGSGQMQISYQPIGNAAPTTLPPLTLMNPSALPVPITSVVRKNGIATVTCSAPHGLQNGIDVQANLLGVADVTFNGTFALQVVKNPNQLTVYQPGLPDAASAGGGVSRVARPFEFMTNVAAERAVITFSNYGNAAGTWVRVKAVTPYVAPSPWATERGTVN